MLRALLSLLHAVERHDERRDQPVASTQRRQARSRLPNGKETVARRRISRSTCAQGEFLVIVGPSGCGKTTVLNCSPGSSCRRRARVALDGRAIAGPGPERGVMFQDYALFPWRTVWGNVEFGLRYGPAGNGLRREARARARAAVRSTSSA